MEISLIEILVLLLLFFPLIKRVIDSLSGKNAPDEESEPTSGPWSVEQVPETEKDLRNISGRTSQSPEEPSSPRHRSYETDHRPSSSPTASSGPSGGQSWEDYHPLHGPVYGEETSRPYESYERQTDRPAQPGKSAGADWSTSTGRTAGAGQSAGVRKTQKSSTEIDSTSDALEEQLEVAVTGKRGRRDIMRILKDPEKIRDGIRVKEILDPPIARRSQHH